MNWRNDWGKVVQDADVPAISLISSGWCLVVRGLSIWLSDIWGVQASRQCIEYGKLKTTNGRPCKGSTIDQLQALERRIWTPRRALLHEWCQHQFSWIAVAVLSAVYSPLWIFHAPIIGNHRSFSWFRVAYWVSSIVFSCTPNAA